MNLNLGKILFIDKNISSFYLIILSVGFLWLDYITGPKILFPIFLIIPISIASWYNDLKQGIMFSLFNVLITCLFPYLWSIEIEIDIIVINAFIRLIIFILLVICLDKISKYTKDLRKKVIILEGFLPICSFCKKIRDQNNDWHVLEEYISAHSEVLFSHSLCPECVKKHYGNLILKK